MRLVDRTRGRTEVDLTIWIIAFASMAALDVAWVLYLRAAAHDQPVRAAVWAAGIHGFSAVSVLTYTNDHRYLSATMLGTILGTYAIVLYHAKRGRKV